MRGPTAATEAPQPPEVHRPWGGHTWALGGSPRVGRRQQGTGRGLMSPPREPLNRPQTPQRDPERSPDPAERHVWSLDPTKRHCRDPGRFREVLGGCTLQRGTVRPLHPRPPSPARRQLPGAFPLLLPPALSVPFWPPLARPMGRSPPRLPGRAPPGPRGGSVMASAPKRFKVRGKPGAPGGPGTHRPLGRGR